LLDTFDIEVLFALNYTNYYNYRHSTSFCPLSRLSGDEIQKSQENIAKEISKGHEFVATAKPLIRIPFIKR